MMNICTGAKEKLTSTICLKKVRFDAVVAKKIRICAIVGF